MAATGTVVGRPSCVKRLSKATHMQFRHLALERAGDHPLSQAFEAMHVGLHHASSVVVAPLLLNTPPQPLAGSQRCIAH